MQLIQPNLAYRFTCLAGECPSTCCRDWNILWHKNEVDKLASIGERKLTDKISYSFSGEGAYRSICFNDNGVCPFLTDSGLCEIHKNYGEEYLPYVCREYPRITRVCDNTVLRSCRTSCYSVMENICRKPDCMDIISSDDVNTAAIISTQDDGKRRLHIYNNVKKEFSIYNNVDTSRLFAEIFGWEIITAKTNEDKQRAKTALSEYCCEEYVDNLIKAVFLEWLINNFCAEYSVDDNLHCFDFCVNAIKLAVSGAACAAEDREQFICTICDIISFLLSNTKKIIIYLSQKS